MAYSDLDLLSQSHHAFKFWKKINFHKISGTFRSRVVQLGPKGNGKTLNNV